MGDCVVLNDSEIGAKNQRNLCAMYTGHDNDGLELIHGLLDHIMKKIDIKFDDKEGNLFYIRLFYQG